MRVKIAYTVEIDEIENEVKEIMQKALLSMEEAHNESHQATINLEAGESDVALIVQAFDSARRKLSKADMVLADCQEILMGYRATLQKIKQEVESGEH
jgi:hypothetical protein|tara:strand:- start:1719 stop:2012 length:294 start_codon:yes stop_codon:yes gene_type:complete